MHCRKCREGAACPVHCKTPASRTTTNTSMRTTGSVSKTTPKQPTLSVIPSKPLEIATKPLVSKSIGDSSSSALAITVETEETAPFSVPQVDNLIEKEGISASIGLSPPYQPSYVSDSLVKQPASVPAEVTPIGNRPFEEEKSSYIAARPTESYSDQVKSTKSFLAVNKKVSGMKTIAEAREALVRLQETLSGVKDTETKFHNFQRAYDHLFSNCLTHILTLETEPLDSLRQQFGVPRACATQEAAQLLAKRIRVVVIVGAGVSVESGVPMYKGNQEKWMVGGEWMTHEEVSKASVMAAHPFDFWTAYHLTKRTMLRCQPNPTHHAISQLTSHWLHIRRSAAVITQNIDNFDREVLGEGVELYEIHGNAGWVRCVEGCCGKLVEAPDARGELEAVPVCGECGRMARPHVLLFDESYSEQLYKSDSALQCAQQADCILVLGTQLQTTLAHRMVFEACKRPDTLILEVNIAPVLRYGNALVIQRPCGQVVPDLVQKAVRLAH